jgi:WD40 repeat protein
MTMWDSATYGPIASFAAHDDAIYAAAFSPDSRTLVTGGRGQEIGIWDGHTAAPKRMLRGHGQFVSGLAFSPDGTRLASASWFLTIKLWDV